MEMPCCFPRPRTLISVSEANPPSLSASSTCLTRSGRRMACIIFMNYPPKVCVLHREVLFDLVLIRLMDQARRNDPSLFQDVIRIRQAKRELQKLFDEDDGNAA